MKAVSRGVIVCLVGVLVAPRLSAQALSFGGGLSIPTGQYNSIAKLGWHATAAVSLFHQNRAIGFQLDADYGHFGLDAAGAGTSLDVGERFLYSTVNLVYRFHPSESARVRPYLIGGVGIYDSKGTGKDAGLFGDTSATDFGLNAGAGFNYDAGRATLFVEARFHNIFSDPSNTQFMPLTVGVRLGG
jgi:hypothetical protein